MAPRVVTWEELSQHNTEADFWTVIDGKVFDLSGFLKQHPGGQKVLQPYAGGNATKAFLAVHSTPIIESSLSADKCIGVIVSQAPPPSSQASSEVESAPSASSSAPAWSEQVIVDDMSLCLNLHDVEAVAKRRLPATSYAYYATGATDEVTLRGNESSFAQLALVPRVMRKVAGASPAGSILGVPVSMPLFISGAAMGKLAHPDGEMNLARACVNTGIIQMCPHLGSCSLEEQAAAHGSAVAALSSVGMRERHIHAQATHAQFLQIYMHLDKSKCIELVKKAEACGVRALFVTVDSATVGKRERDMRLKPGGSAPRSGSSLWDADLSWDTLAWLKTVTALPIVLKGVQCGADAVLAAQHGCAGVLVSNHGGRNLDTARPTLRALAEVTAALEAAGLKGKLEVFLDGGVRRGTDIFKALALGATAVGIGRPALFGMAAFGQPGVEHVVEVLRKELAVTMMNTGAATLADIDGSMVEGLHELQESLLSRMARSSRL